MCKGWDAWLDKYGRTYGASGDHIRNQYSSGKSRGSISSYFSVSARMIVKGYTEMDSWIIAT